MKTAVVIGAGLGGLAVSIRLRARGWNVTVLEAGPTFGGKMNRWQSQGFTFDTGPSLITMPWVFAELFEAGGTRIEDHVELQCLDPIAEYYFPDGTRFEYSSSLPEWLATIRRLEPADVDGFLRFLQLGARLWEVSKRTFLNRSPLEWPTAKDRDVLKFLPVRHAWANYHASVAAHFRSPHLRQLFDRYPTYVGSSPYLSPATLAVIPYIEFAFGGFAVKGGLYRIIESLVEVARANGIELQSCATVNRIVTEGKRARGVVLEDGRSLRADIVIMNGDAAATATLLGAPPAPLRARSLSGLVFLFGLRRALKNVQPHSICFSADYRTEFHQLFSERRFPDDPTVYVNVPSRTDRSLAPGHGETVFVMANAPASTEPWDVRTIAEARRRVFTRLRKSGFPEFENDVVVSDVWTPARIADRYLMPGGAIYGTDSHGWRNAFLRPPNRHPKIHGLYHVGGSTHPGGGTPTVLLSAQITAGLIGRYERG